MIGFLCVAFEYNSLIDILGDKTTRVTCKKSCFSYSCINGRIVKASDNELISTHEEADTRVLLHLSKISFPAPVVICTSDTDVMVVAISNIGELDRKLNVYLEVGVQSKYTFSYIDVSSIVANLGPEFS